MASALPVLSGREVVRVFESLGWEFARQSASHIILVTRLTAKHLADHERISVF